jgi:FMN phosphatase YigB (HAD superfamily)
MKTIRATRSVFFDVDDTLVIWDWKSVNPEGKGLVTIKDPNSGVAELVHPHLRHIELMRQFKARGHTVFVWSQGGHEWAEATCKALGIENLVDFVLDKPNWYVDDLPVGAWMKSPIYLDVNDPSKDSRWQLPETIKGDK